MAESVVRNSIRPGVRVSVAGAFLLLSWDAILFGSFGASILACPLWFLASIVKNAVERPGWRLAGVRIVIPAITLGLVCANSSVQYQTAQANASRVVSACEQFYLAEGRYPKTLDEVVPRYLKSVPRAKYCLIFGEFLYWKTDDTAVLIWYAVPPFGRWAYDFENRDWRYID